MYTLIRDDRLAATARFFLAAGILAVVGSILLVTLSVWLMTEFLKVDIDVHRRLQLHGSFLLIGLFLVITSFLRADGSVTGRYFHAGLSQKRKKAVSR